MKRLILLTLGELAMLNNLCPPEVQVQYPLSNFDYKKDLGFQCAETTNLQKTYGKIWIKLAELNNCSLVNNFCAMNISNSINNSTSNEYNLFD